MIRKILVLSFLIVLDSVYSQVAFVSLSDKKSCDFIENLFISNKIKIAFQGDKPYRVKEIYPQLLKLKKSSKTDRVLDSFIRYFEDKYIDSKHRLVSMDKHKSTFWAEPYIRETLVDQKLVSGKDHIDALLTTGGFEANVNYRDFSFYTNTYVTINHNKDSLRDKYAVVSNYSDGAYQGFSSDDQTETYLDFARENMSVSFGKYQIAEGVGYKSLTLSSQKNYFESFRFQWVFDKFKFSTIAGFLTADNETRYELIDSSLTNGEWSVRGNPKKRAKYLSSHRVEYHALDNLRFGINETVISGDRPIEAGYLLPIMPLRWMEHYYGDQDNATMSFDFHYIPVQNYAVYGELFVDDETYQESFTEFYGNKWAFLVGVYNANFLTIPYLNFRFEYSRIEPFVYTHKYHINRYKNGNSFLGGKYGPDSEEMYFRLDYNFLSQFNFSAEYTRANVGQPIPGKEDQPDYANDIKTFMRGIVEKNYVYSADVEYYYNKNITLGFHYGHTDILNRGHISKDSYSNNTFGLEMEFVLSSLKPMNLLK